MTIDTLRGPSITSSAVHIKEDDYERHPSHNRAAPSHGSHVGKRNGDPYHRSFHGCDPGRHHDGGRRLTESFAMFLRLFQSIDRAGSSEPAPFIGARPAPAPSADR